MVISLLFRQVYVASLFAHGKMSQKQKRTPEGYKTRPVSPNAPRATRKRKLVDYPEDSVDVLNHEEDSEFVENSDSLLDETARALRIHVRSTKRRLSFADPEYYDQDRNVIFNDSPVRPASSPKRKIAKMIQITENWLSEMRALYGTMTDCDDSDDEEKDGECRDDPDVSIIVD